MGSAEAAASALLLSGPPAELLSKHFILQPLRKTGDSPFYLYVHITSDLKWFQKPDLPPERTIRHERDQPRKNPERSAQTFKVKAVFLP